MCKSRYIYLGILKHLLQALLHLLEFTRLNAAIGQQHASKLSLSDSAIHWVIPFKLEREKNEIRLSSKQRDKQISSGGRGL